MASKKIGVALGIAVAAFVLVAFATPASAQNLADPKNQGRCNTLFNATLATLYANDTTCANLIFLAFNATNKALCPPGGSAVGSPVHLCMNKNNTGTYASTWASIIASCEYMYVANRQGAGESETGFTYNDQNTCFQAFDSFSAFSAWLNNASPYGGVAQGDNAATLVQTALWTLLGALALALMVFLQ